MVYFLGEDVEILLFSIKYPFHFAMALKDSTLINGKDWGEQVSIDFTCGMDFYTSLGIYLPLHQTINDDRIDPDLSFDDCCFTNDECSAFEDFSLEFPIQTKYAFKGHLSFKEGLLSQISANFLWGGGRDGAAFRKNGFSS